MPALISFQALSRSLLALVFGGGTAWLIVLTAWLMRKIFPRELKEFERARLFDRAKLAMLALPSGCIVSISYLFFLLDIGAAPIDLAAYLISFIASMRLAYKKGVFGL